MFKRLTAGPGRALLLAKLSFVLAGTASFLLSVWLWFVVGDRETGMYVGLWVPSLFALGALVTGGSVRR
jgi:hypothetical protein